MMKSSIQSNKIPTKSIIESSYYFSIPLHTERDTGFKTFSSEVSVGVNLLTIINIFSSFPGLLHTVNKQGDVWKFVGRVSNVGFVIALNRKLLRASVVQRSGLSSSEQINLVLCVVMKEVITDDDTSISEE
uniref:Uncharacterized protein n=1 Tax=Trichobilharzia regenti TaxID=157069 RepID=A0AA85KLA7_TRIRE|nr:unnamed protein product [Trichobilharzia regenti]